MGVSNRKSTPSKTTTTTTTKSPHNLGRGLWLLLRLHTFEGFASASIGWLALFLYAVEQRMAFGDLQDVIFGILASYGITHGVFCMWNDICDVDFDAQVARTKKRPLPSGMVTYAEAVLAFIIGTALSVSATYYLLGEGVTVTMVPIWGLSFIYPLAKRVIWAPQLILGVTMAACVLPPWVALGNDWSTGAGGTRIGLPASLFGAIFSWLVYVDLIYASQDRPDDEKAGVKSLAVLLGDNLKLGLSVLGMLQIVFFTLVAIEAKVSALFWVAGVGVWAVCVPWSVMSLDLRDRNSGGKIFLRNALLGIYASAVAAGDVWVSSREVL